ncbi:MAG: hypothetical protein AMJ42_01875 [Deltaproteobacteria bacterium DG_8]|nr:MAG: hypothetical protein AMJ42_01875 [Deltaproteobacteria bacterium DG_8]
MIDLKNIFIVILVLTLSLFCFFYPQAEQLAERGGKEFSLKEKLWAAKWMSEKLCLLMEDGLIKMIKCSEDESSYEVFVSSSWHLLGTEEKRDFLRNLSRAREITQHSPYLVVKNVDSGEIVAQVNEWGILIFGKEGEKFIPNIPPEVN